MEVEIADAKLSTWERARHRCRRHQLSALEETNGSLQKNSSRGIQPNQSNEQERHICRLKPMKGAEVNENLHILPLLVHPIHNQVLRFTSDHHVHDRVHAANAGQNFQFTVDVPFVQILGEIQ